jgi:hypothetical protein
MHFLSKLALAFLNHPWAPVAIVAILIMLYALWREQAEEGEAKKHPDEAAPSGGSFVISLKRAGLVSILLLVATAILILILPREHTLQPSTGPKTVIGIPSTAALEPKSPKPVIPATPKKSFANAPMKFPTKRTDKGISLGKDSVAMGNIPEGSRIGNRSVMVGPTDAHGNTILNQGGLAVGYGAKADSTSTAIGAHANAGKSGTATPATSTTSGPSVGSVNVQPGGVASFGQQGGITAGQINLFDRDQAPITLSYSQTANTVTVKTSGRIDYTTLAFVFDTEVSLVSHSLGSCMRCGDGRLNDSTGLPDKKTIWLFWASPPFIPERPLVVTFYSTSPAKLLKVVRGPEPPL